MLFSSSLNNRIYNIMKVSAKREPNAREDKDLESALDFIRFYDIKKTELSFPNCIDNYRPLEYQPVVKKKKTLSKVQKNIVKSKVEPKAKVDSKKSIIQPKQDVVQNNPPTDLGKYLSSLNAAYEQPRQPQLNTRISSNSTTYNLRNQPTRTSFLTPYQSYPKPITTETASSAFRNFQMKTDFTPALNSGQRFQDSSQLYKSSQIHTSNNQATNYFDSAYLSPSTNFTPSKVTTYNPTTNFTPSRLASYTPSTPPSNLEQYYSSLMRDEPEVKQYYNYNNQDRTSQLYTSQVEKFMVNDIYETPQRPITPPFKQKSQQRVRQSPSELLASKLDRLSRKQEAPSKIRTYRQERDPEESVQLKYKEPSERSIKIQRLKASEIKESKISKKLERVPSKKPDVDRPTKFKNTDSHQYFDDSFKDKLEQLVRDETTRHIYLDLSRLDEASDPERLYQSEDDQELQQQLAKQKQDLASRYAVRKSQYSYDK